MVQKEQLATGQGCFSLQPYTCVHVLLEQASLLRHMYRGVSSSVIQRMAALTYLKHDAVLGSDYRLAVLDQ